MCIFPADQPYAERVEFTADLKAKGQKIPEQPEIIGVKRVEVPV